MVRVVKATTELEESVDALNAARSDMGDKRLEFRAALAEAFTDGYTYQELASTTGLNVESIRSHIRWHKEKRKVRDW